MSSPADFALWIVITLMEAFVCGLIVFRGRLQKYRMLACYFAGSVSVESVRAGTFLHYGIRSMQFHYIYNYTDCLLTLLLYFAVVEHYGLFCDSGVTRKYVRGGSFVLAACVGIFCFLLTAQSSATIATHLVINYSQNLFFVTAAIGVILFAASLWKRGVLLHDRLLAFVLASYFVLTVRRYLLQGLYPSYTSIDSYSGTLLWTLLPLGVAYIFSDPDTGKDGPCIYL
jgi:hypothetical protein